MLFYYLLYIAGYAQEQGNLTLRYPVLHFPPFHYQSEENEYIEYFILASEKKNEFINIIISKMPSSVVPLNTKQNLKINRKYRATQN